MQIRFPRLPKIPYAYLIVLPLLSILLGTASNQAVLVANWDKFPVMVNDKKLAEFEAQQDPEDQSARFDINITDKLYPNFFKSHPADKKAVEVAKKDSDDMIDDIHCIMTKHSRLKALADIIDLGDSIYSIGDVFITLGSFLLNFTPLMWAGLALRKLILAEKA